MITITVHEPNYSARPVGLDVHAHAHIGNAAAVRGDLRVRDPLQIEHIDGLERGLSGSATLGTAANGSSKHRETQGDGASPERRHLPLSIIPASPGDPAIALVFIHDPHRLHEGMANSRTDEAEASLLELLCSWRRFAASFG